MTALLAAVLGGLALLLGRPPAGWVARYRLGLAGGPGGRRPGPRALVIGGAVGLTTAVVMAGDALPGRGIVTGGVAMVALGLALFIANRVAAGRRRGVIDRRRAQVGLAIDLLGAELRAGVLPERALVAVSTDLALLAPAGAMAWRGGDVAAVLRVAAQEPGAAALRELAQAWAVAERVGAPLSSVLDRVAEGLRSELAVAREAAAEAAPARATGRLMAGLPLLGLALGSGLGADPVRVLLTTGPGVVCLALGAAAACAGTLWIDRLADRVLVSDG